MTLVGYLVWMFIIFAIADAIRDKDYKHLAPISFLILGFIIIGGGIYIGSTLSSEQLKYYFSEGSPIPGIKVVLFGIFMILGCFGFLGYEVGESLFKSKIGGFFGCLFGVIFALFLIGGSLEDKSKDKRGKSKY